MKARTFALLPAVALLGFLTACDVDVKDEGKLPDVDVDVEPGRNPDVDVTAPDVDLDTKETTITVPEVDVDVDTEEKPITVPDIDVDIPDEEDNEPGAPPATPPSM